MNGDIIKLILFVSLVGGFSYLVGITTLLLGRVKVQTIHHLISPVLGLAILALQLWTYGLVGIHWNRLTLLVPWIIILIILHKKIWAAAPGIKTVKSARQTFLELDALSKVLVIASIVFGMAYLISLAVQPVITSDVLAIWGYKAKEFFFHQQVYVSPNLYSTVNSARFFHVDYPPLLPLMGDVFYVILGHTNEGSFKLLQALFLFSGSAGLFTYLKNSSGQKRNNLQIASLATFLLVAAPQFIPMLFKVQYMGYADFPLAIVMLIATLFLARFISTDDSTDWWLALLFASFAAVTKNEGVPFLVIIILVLLALRLWPLLTKLRNPDFKSILYSIGGCLFVLSPLIIWSIYKQKHGLAVDFKISNLRNSHMSAISRLHQIISYVWLYIKTNPAFHWEVLALLLAGLASAIRRTKLNMTIALVVFAQLASYLVSYVFSPYDLKFHVLSSIDRLLTQTLPLIILLLAVNIVIYSQKRNT